MQRKALKSLFSYQQGLEDWRAAPASSKDSFPGNLEGLAGVCSQSQVAPSIPHPVEDMFSPLMGDLLELRAFKLIFHTAMLYKIPGGNE